MTREIKFRAFAGRYEAGSDGQVYSNDFNHTGKRKALKSYPDDDGYPQVYMYIDGKRIIRAAHKVIAAAWLGDKPTPKHQVNHKNGIRDDNRPENLEYLTSRENTIHGWRRGRVVSEKHRANGRKQMQIINALKYAKAA
ncbi:MAG: HNH endonuclease signature motif containing protein [Candidatus Paceibacterota bacterium]|jgi:hypothetical protein